MATPLKPRTYVPRLRDNRIDGVKYNRSSSKRNNFEMFAWLGIAPVRRRTRRADFRSPVLQPHGR